jgi:hypothetical protein
MFVVEKKGTIRIIGFSTAFLDSQHEAMTYSPCSFLEPSVGLPLGVPLAPRIQSAVSIAVPPDYDSKAYFYVSYISLDGALTVSRLTALNDPNEAHPLSEEVSASYPAPTCNGGQLTFSADGILYLNTQSPVANAILPGFTNDLNVVSGKMIPILNENGGPIPNASSEISWPFSSHLPPTECWAIGGQFADSLFGCLSGAYVYGTGDTVRVLKSNGTNWTTAATLAGHFSLLTVVAVWTSAHWDGKAGRIYVANFGRAFWQQAPPPVYAYQTILGSGIYLLEDDPTQFSIRARTHGFPHEPLNGRFPQE